MAKLKEEYQSRIFGELEKKLGLTNKMLVPRLQKVVVNMAFGIVSKDEQKGLVEDLQAITGQKPLLCKAKKSISNFKLREALPRIRDFRGVSNRGFDGRGNYTLGLKEHSIFPELVESAPGHSGMDITFVTSSQDNKAARELLVALGMPFAGRN